MLDTSVSLYTTGALQAGNLGLELRGSESEQVSPCGVTLISPQEELLRAPATSSTDSIPAGFPSQ